MDNTTKSVCRECGRAGRYGPSRSRAFVETQGWQSTPRATHRRPLNPERKGRKQRCRNSARISLVARGDSVEIQWSEWDRVFNNSWKSLVRVRTGTRCPFIHIAQPHQKACFSPHTTPTLHIAHYTPYTIHHIPHTTHHTPHTTLHTPHVTRRLHKPPSPRPLSGHPRAPPHPEPQHTHRPPHPPLYHARLPPLARERRRVPDVGAERDELV